ncbi:MAG: hypothetical protein GC162_06820 [Planctomycetes bacterium]|nr:hypothetical protein [Planctomycetota bacterium]
MHMERRHFLIGSLALVAAGCEQNVRTVGSSGNMSGVWPNVNAAPPVARTVPPPQTPSQAQQQAVRPPAGSIQPISRDNWTHAGPRLSDINPMNGVNKLTIHHDGMPEAVTFTDYNSSRSYLELIRRSHLQRGWSDIGYHYVIDRAGRLWEGRDLRYQGAHVKDHNEHNIGVMCMGNFDIQSPSAAQLEALHGTVRQLRRFFSISENQIYTHQEINPTSCPGRALQPRVVSMRSSHLFA